MSSIFFDAPAILEAAQVPPGTPNAERIASKIWNDGEVRSIAMQLAIDAYLLAALHKMNAGQLSVLHKRAEVPAAAAPSGVRWIVCPFNERSGNRLCAIQVESAGEKLFFTGPPENAALFQFRGQKCPAWAVEEYAQLYPTMEHVIPYQPTLSPNEIAEQKANSRNYGK